MNLHGAVLCLLMGGLISTRAHGTKGYHSKATLVFPKAERKDIKTKESSFISSNVKREKCFGPFHPEDCSKLAGIKYYFDSRKGKCSKFYYSGCNGNRNRFNSERDCLTKCKKEWVENPLADIHRILMDHTIMDRHACSQRRVEGSCPRPRLAYRFDKKKCKAFLFRGCSESGLNHFDDLAQCQKACLPRQNTRRKKRRAQKESEEEETLNLKTNSKKKKMETSKSSGKRKIPKICRLHKATGPCKAIQPSFYYDWKKGHCRPFLYGGCNGNENRFKEKKDCEELCGR